MLVPLALISLLPSLFEDAHMPGPFPEPKSLDRTIVAPGIGEELNDYLTRVEGFGYMGTMLVIKDGHALIHKAYGFADRDKRIPNDINSLYDIGSLSKQFTAAAVLKLEAAGALKVTDTLGRFIAEAPEAFKDITLHQLLQHRAGIGSAFGPFDDVTKQDALKRIFSKPLQFKPGERFEYSNEGYTLLAAVVEKASGRRFQDYLIEEIFGPAGMRHTGFYGKLLPKTPKALIAEGHDESSILSRLEKQNADNWADLGSGEVVSTTSDLYRWFLALQRNTVLSAEQEARLWTPGQPAVPSDAFFTESYGYGWMVQTLLNGHRRIGHGGDAVAHGAEFNMYPDDRMLVISLCNIRHDVFPSHVRADRFMHKIVLGEKRPEPPYFSKVRGFREPIGEYKLASGGLVKIWHDKAGLQIGADGQDAVNLIDPAPADKVAERDTLNSAFEATWPKLIAGDKKAWIPFGGGEPFTSGALGEVLTYGKGKGKLLRVRSTGTYKGGFSEYAQVMRAEFEHGWIPYKISWGSATHIDVTWPNSPPWAAATPLQPVTDKTWIAWNLITRKVTRIRVTPEGIVVEGPEATASAVRT